MRSLKARSRRLVSPESEVKKVPNKDLQAFEEMSISSSSSHDTVSHTSGEDIYASSSEAEWNEGSDETIDNVLNN